MVLLAQLFHKIEDKRFYIFQTSEHRLERNHPASHGFRLLHLIFQFDLIHHQNIQCQDSLHRIL